jgi:hypothetical protein
MQLYTNPNGLNFQSSYPIKKHLFSDKPGPELMDETIEASCNFSPAKEYIYVQYNIDRL